MLLRGFTNNKQQKEVFKTTRSKNKANKILTSFIEHFWKRFHERLQKFCCEIMIEWEKNQGITTVAKKKKVKKRKKSNKDKENTRPLEPLKETKSEKESRIQKETSNKIDKWVKSGKKEEQLHFKI